MQPIWCWTFPIMRAWCTKSPLDLVRIYTFYIRKIFLWTKNYTDACGWDTSKQIWIELLFRNELFDLKIMFLDPKGKKNCNTFLIELIAKIQMVVQML